MIGVSQIRTRLIHAAMIALMLAIFIGPQQVLAARTCTVRYYMSPMVGSGTDDDPYRPLVVDLPSYPHHSYAIAWTAVYGGIDTSTGGWISPYALVAVASYNHKPLLKNPDLGVFPDEPLDKTIYEFTTEEMNALVDIRDRFGLDRELLNESALYSDVFFFIARILDPLPPDGVPTVSCPS